MQPDQPLQPTDPMAPQPAAPPVPTPDPAISPAPPTPDPSMGMAPTPAPEPMPSPVASPAPVAMAPVDAMPQSSPAPMPSPSVPPTPAVAPAMATPPAQQPVLDSSQPGYVPPANPLPPVPLSGNSANSAGRKSGKLRIIIAVVIALFFFLGGGFILKDVLFTGSKITKADLVDDSADGVSFKRPKDWTKSTDSDSEATVFTEGGKPADETDQALAVLSQAIGIKYESLTDSQRQQVFDSIEKEFSKPSTLEDDTCKEVVDIKVTKSNQPNYTDSILVEATCNKFTNRALKAKLKMMIGMKDSNMHIIGISAVDKTWDKSGDALDEILNTFKPAN